MADRAHNQPQTVPSAPAIATDDPAALAYHRRFYSARAWTDVTWREVRTLKCPLDLVVYQEILDEV